MNKVQRIMSRRPEKPIQTMMSNDLVCQDFPRVCRIPHVCRIPAPRHYNIQRAGGSIGWRREKKPGAGISYKKPGLLVTVADKLFHAFLKLFLKQ